jgi:hypothetical protein
MALKYGMLIGAFAVFGIGCSSSDGGTGTQPMMVVDPGAMPAGGAAPVAMGGSGGNPFAGDVVDPAAGSPAVGMGGGGGMTADTGDLIPLPMTVDFYFFPAGAMGRLIDPGADGLPDTPDECGTDAADDVGEYQNLVTTQSAEIGEACATRPDAVLNDAELGLSRCTSFDFTPGINTGGTFPESVLDPMENTTWTGVLWQNEPCNWGLNPGTGVAQGATKVTFWAWADTAGQVIDFQAGGIFDLQTSYADTFTASLPGIELTTTPTQYEINLSVAYYTPEDGVLSPFGWSAERADETQLKFYIDGVRWE